MCVLICVLVLTECAGFAATDPYAGVYPAFTVNAAVSDSALNMYADASASGRPIASYKTGTLLHVTAMRKNSRYCRAIGPDGREGYVNIDCLDRVCEYEDEFYPLFMVTSEYDEGGKRFLYMYGSAGASGVKLGRYENGTFLRVIDYYCDEVYALVAAPDGRAGFVRKAWISMMSGSWPDSDWSLPAQVYENMLENMRLSGSSSRRGR
ncbi:MAG: hypothetical protein IKR85_00280 [Clostridia bacterium]|nr:hypothetical protein [Clostridia bacterium]